MSVSGKILVLVTSYPGDGTGEAHRFVHVRNLHYVKRGFNLVVLDFSATQSFEYEGIRVIPPKAYSGTDEGYDLLITHQANIRHHYRFLKRHGRDFPAFVFFFHGHEVLRFKTTYPKPYSYIAKTPLKTATRDFYDTFKLFVWRNYIPKVLRKSTLVFVSEWMLDEFLKSTRITLDCISDKCRIAYNCVGELFQDGEYDWARPKAYDCVTIRNDLDGSKYCIDIVNRLAWANPSLRFLVVGRGSFFDHYEKAPNLNWMDCTLSHSEIIKVLQDSRCALMPTRCDSQGLMACEMATFCMPVITSDISACHEALDAFPNVWFFDNDTTPDLQDILSSLETGMPYEKVDMFFSANTITREVEIFEDAIRAGGARGAK